MDVAEAGSTGASLALTLGLSPGSRFTVVNPPEGLGRWIAPLPEGVIYQEMGGEEPLDFALLFALGDGKLSLTLPKLRQCLKPDGRVWISWKREPSASDRARLAEEGMKEVERSAIGADWLAIRFLLGR